MQGSCVVWFNRDLRLSDNEAFSFACSLGVPVIPLYLSGAELLSKPKIGAASRWWLHESLQSLDLSLKDSGSRLIVHSGVPQTAILDVVREANVSIVVWNKCYDPQTAEVQSSIRTELEKANVRVKLFKGDVFLEPDQILNGTGRPYKVFTPFWKACLQKGFETSVKECPAEIASPVEWPSSVGIDQIRIKSAQRWSEKLHDAWIPGEKQGHSMLETFVSSAMNLYSKQRDYPNLFSTSHLSPYLSFGEISPKQILAYVRAKSDLKPEAFIRQLGWREFSSYLLYHFPRMQNSPLRQEFRNFEWQNDKNGLSAWQIGATGYPIVDAGMRQLWKTGWMHNRVRMIVASFLVKDLLIDWKLGAAWFWDTLVDADIANNSAGWQWVAGCGADAAPYFRIFNPVLQGNKFDPDGAYVREWVPELKKLPDKYIHSPWTASKEELFESGIIPGETYPHPIIDHSFARDRALSRFSLIK